jgi:hypothetical protein
MKVSI